MELAVFDLNMLGIPEGGAAEFGHLRIADHQAVIVPEGIAQIEKAVIRLDVFTLFEGALAVGRAVESAVFRREAARAVEGALPVERLVFDDGHGKASCWMGAHIARLRS